MALGALIVTAGAHHAADITSLSVPAGSVTAGCRMISAFQRAGVSRVWLVTGPENKKAERQFAGDGVFFLHQEPAAETVEQAVHFGLSQLPADLDGVFVVGGDTPLFLPQTLEKLLQSKPPVVRPAFQGEPGWPFLLRGISVQTLPTNLWDLAELVSVEDPGVCAMPSTEDHLQIHSKQLTRPVLGVALDRGVPFFDARLSALLHLVDETQSVRDACRMLQISYSAAWQMLNRAEAVTGFPLIFRNRGGPSGKGSLLTEKGRRLMEAYDGFSTEMERISQKFYSEEFQNKLF